MKYSAIIALALFAVAQARPTMPPADSNGAQAPTDEPCTSSEVVYGDDEDTDPESIDEEDIDPESIDEEPYEGSEAYDKEKYGPGLEEATEGQEAEYNEEGEEVTEGEDVVGEQATESEPYNVALSSQVEGTDFMMRKESSSASTIAFSLAFSLAFAALI